MSAPPNPNWIRFWSGLALGTWGATSGWTQPTPAHPKSEPENPEEFSRVQGLFDVDLPKTVERLRPKLRIHPHFGDFLHRSYLRLPVAVRFGLSDHLELNAEVESYLAPRQIEAELLRGKIEGRLDPRGMRARLLARRAAQAS